MSIGGRKTFFSLEKNEGQDLPWLSK